MKMPNCNITRVKFETIPQDVNIHPPYEDLEHINEIALLLLTKLEQAEDHLFFTFNHRNDRRALRFYLAGWFTAERELTNKFSLIAINQRKLELKKRFTYKPWETPPEKKTHRHEFFVSYPRGQNITLWKDEFTSQLHNPSRRDLTDKWRWR